MVLVILMIGSRVTYSSSPTCTLNPENFFSRFGIQIFCVLEIAIVSDGNSLKSKFCLLHLTFYCAAVMMLHLRKSTGCYGSTTISVSKSFILRCVSEPVNFLKSNASSECTKSSRDWFPLCAVQRTNAWVFKRFCSEACLRRLCVKPDYAYFFLSK